MALNINGTTGISGVDGSNSAPALQGADSNTGVSFGSDIIDLNTGGSSRFKVGAAGQLGVAGANYGTSGQALVSQGASAAPQWATVGGGGKILQVGQGYKIASQSFTSTSAVDLTDLSVTMTASSSSNKILLRAFVGFGADFHNLNMVLFGFRVDSTEIGNPTGGTENCISMNYALAANPSDAEDYMFYNTSFEYLYTPGDTSSHTYKVFGKTNAGNSGGKAVVVNRRGSNSTGFQSASGITVMEVAA